MNATPTVELVDLDVTDADEVTDAVLMPVVLASPFLTALWDDGQRSAALEFAWQRYTG